MASPPHKFEIQDAGRKGRGLFATQSIEPGEVVLSCKPDFAFENHEGKLCASAYDIYTAYLAMSQTQRDEYLMQDNGKQFDWGWIHTYGDEVIDQNMSDEKIERDLAGTIVAMFWTNAREYNDVQTGVPMMGIFIKASFLNHDCTPNVCHVWDEQVGKKVFRAIHRIEVGEELTEAYIPDNLLLPFPERHTLLLGAYGFECLCKACDQSSDFGQQSAIRRGALKELFHQRLAGSQEDRKLVCQTMIGLLEEEGLKDWNIGDM
jgi:hypothetical protein